MKNVEEHIIKHIIKNLLKGLSHCHKKRIMHRDLKPENIMLKSNKRLYSVKIIDFGLG